MIRATAVAAILALANATPCDECKKTDTDFATEMIALEADHTGKCAAARTAMMAMTKCFNDQNSGVSNYAAAATDIQTCWDATVTGADNKTKYANGVAKLAKDAACMTELVAATCTKCKATNTDFPNMMVQLQADHSGTKCVDAGAAMQTMATCFATDGAFDATTELNTCEAAAASHAGQYTAGVAKLANDGVCAPIIAAATLCSSCINSNVQNQAAIMAVGQQNVQLDATNCGAGVAAMTAWNKCFAGGNAPTTQTDAAGKTCIEGAAAKVQGMDAVLAEALKNLTTQDKCPAIIATAGRSSAGAVTLGAATVAAILLA